MAIKDTEKTKAGTTEKELEVTIDNGDLESINSLIDAYSFKDKSSLIKFAIGTLLQGTNNEGLYTPQFSTRRFMSLPRESSRQYSHP